MCIQHLNYTASLEDELHKMRNAMNTLHNNMQMGLDIEQHLKKKVQTMERKLVASDDIVRTGLTTLRDFHSHQRTEVLNLLEEEGVQFKLVLDEVRDMMRQYNSNTETQCNSSTELNISDTQIDKVCDAECRDLHIASNADSSSNADAIHI